MIEYPLVPHTRCGAVGISQACVDGWTIDLDDHGLFDSPGDTMSLPIHNGETVLIEWVPCNWLCQ